MSDRIEKQVEITAPVERVWKALTDHEEFGAWFKVKLDGPFVEGETSTGHMTWPGYEHLRWTAVVKTIEPMTRFAFTWHPYAIQQDVDYSNEEPTLVEFVLEPTPTGTLVKVSESGFDKVPEARRELAFRMNEKGWATQVERVKNYVLTGAV